MKKVFTVIISVCLLHIVYAGNGHGYGDRNKNQKFTMAFNAGVAIPTGGFAKKDTLPYYHDTTHAYGFAKTGFQFNIDLSFRFATNFGVAGRVGGALCQWDAAGYTQVYKIPSNETVSPNGKHYIGEYLLGPYFYFPASDNFAVEVKLLLGLISSSYPEYSVYSNVPGNYASTTIKYSVGSGFGYALSVSGRLKVEENIAIVASANYSGSQMKYPGLLYTATTPSSYGYSVLSTTVRTMSLGIVSFTLGFAITF